MSNEAQVYGTLVNVNLLAEFDPARILLIKLTMETMVSVLIKIFLIWDEPFSKFCAGFNSYSDLCRYAP